MRMKALLTCLGLSASSLIAGCGSDIDRNLADPRVIAGGGAGDGEIAGRINVHVLDADTDAAIEGAMVYIGESGEALISGTTDATGLFTLDDDGLEGPTTVTITAEGYPAATWYGINAVNITVPLDAGAAGDPVPQATLDGTIEGWENMPDPVDQNHITLAFVTYSQTDELGDEANEIAQPDGQPFPPNVCAINALLPSGPCNWSLNSRTGTVAVYAVIVDLDTQGTFADDSDDTVEVIGLAYSLGNVVQDGVDQSGITLAMLAPEDMVAVDLITAGLPAGTDESFALVGIDIGASGVIYTALPGMSEDGPVQVPALTGDFAGGTYQGLAFASDSNTENRGSLIFVEDITDVSTGLDFGAWLELPSALSLTAGEYSFAPVTDVVMHTTSLSEPGGDEVWNIAVFDGRTSFALPEISPDPLPAGDIDMTVTALEGEVDLTDFSIDEFTDTVHRTSSNTATFTP